ncbi:subtilisin-like serine protease [Ceratobasidium sp. UAMH 11750]|nr:subtilisin-like serine protease [Ceratobasidium sp. UAMH 11750]
MHVSVALGALALVVPALSAPTLVPISKHAGPVKPNSYLVTFQDAASKEAFLKMEPSFTQPGSGVTYNYDIIDALAMMLYDAGDLSLVQKLAGVKSIEPDGIASIDYEVGLDGLEVSGHKPSACLSKRLQERASNGAGVVIYGIDTGIYTAHNCFGGRAKWGATFGGYADKDGNGHGTHTAGTAACSSFQPGAAGAAQIFSVKVLSDKGAGAYSDIIAGVNWVVQQFQADKSKPSIATMSLGGPANNAMDDAVRSAISKGVHFTIAAGNSNVDASTSSPARVQGANTIGAVDSTNQKASFSNYGPLIDVWYYGVNVVSAWIDGPDSTKSLSGTSMATPGVAALLAAALGNYGQMSPGDLSNALKQHGANKVTYSVADTVPASLTSTRKLAQPW